MNEPLNRDAHVLLLLLILAIIVILVFCIPTGKHWDAQNATIGMNWKQGLWPLGIAAVIFAIKRLIEKGRKIG